MRIAFVTPEYITNKFDGGLANYVYRVALSLVQLGHQPIVVVSSDKDEISVLDGIEIHQVRINKNLWLSRLNYVTRRRFRMSVNLIQQSWELNAKLRQLHAQQPLTLIQYAHLGGIGLFRLSKVPSVVRLSSYTPLWQANGGYDYENPFMVRQQAFWERWALRRADGVFAPSEVIARTVEKETGKSVEIIETPFILENGSTDESLYHEVLKEKTYLLFFGILNVLKGVVTIAEAISELLGKYPHLYFVFIGKEEGGYKGTSMMDYVWQKAGPYRNRVLYLGKMPHERLYPILRHAHAVVLPSRIDNFPNTCLEAMAHKRVVIGTRGASFEQLLVDGQNGFLCEIDNPTSLLEAIEKALGLTEDERAKMGQRAWGRAYQQRPEIVARQLLSFYHKAVSKNYIN